jgi:hypothetical protein
MKLIEFRAGSTIQNPEDRERRSSKWIRDRKRKRK